VPDASVALTETVNGVPAVEDADDAITAN